MKALLMTWMTAVMPVVAGPYAPRAGDPGSTAIHMNDARFVSWASGNLAPEYGQDVDTIWRTPAKAFNKATDNVYDIVCLGNGGRITLYFPHPIRDGEGADFAVFENSFSDLFLELAFVEVSSDGVNFFRFPAFSRTGNPEPQSEQQPEQQPEVLDPPPVGALGNVDPTDIHGLAGKYRGGYGTPFDLHDVADSPLLDKQNVRFVRIVDIIGNGFTKDSLGLPIYDPFPTTGSGGFDLDAIGVIHQNDGQFPLGISLAAKDIYKLSWGSNPGSRYRIETSLTMDSLEPWLPLWTGAGDQASGTTSFAVPVAAGEGRRFWRVVRQD